MPVSFNSDVIALKRCVDSYAGIRQTTAQMRAQIAAGSVGAIALIAFHDQLVNTWDINIRELDGRSDLDELATAHMSGVQGSFQEHFAAIKAAGGAVVSYIESGLPAANGWLSVVRFFGTPARQDWRSFTTVQLSGLDALLEELIAAIDAVG